MTQKLGHNLFKLIIIFSPAFYNELIFCFINLNIIKKPRNARLFLNCPKYAYSILKIKYKTYLERKIFQLDINGLIEIFAKGLDTKITKTILELGYAATTVNKTL